MLLKRAQSVNKVNFTLPIQSIKKASLGMATAGLNEQRISTPTAAPAGLCLSGEIPEEIALSIFAEYPAMLNQANTNLLSKLL